MSRYTLIVACLHCELELDAVTQGTTDGRSTNAIARCPECGREYLIAVALSPARGANRDNGCGTTAGYLAHCRRYEPACPACRDAHAAAARRRRTAA